jgi:hypothetical protein
VATHPAVRIDVTEERPGQHFTMADFTPPYADGAPLTLYASFDWSFTLECGRFILFEDEPMNDDDEDARVALVVGEIESVATGGLSRSRFDRLIGGSRDRVAPWSA